MDTKPDTIKGSELVSWCEYAGTTTTSASVTPDEIDLSFADGGSSALVSPSTATHTAAAWTE